MKRVLTIIMWAGILSTLTMEVACYKILTTGSAIEGDAQRVARLYHSILVQTGLSNQVPPIRVMNNDVVNAYNDGKEIVIFTGIIKVTKNDDELAMIIGHEIAHTTLWHFYLQDYITKIVGRVPDGDQEIMESMADKMGAFYAIKAGYSVCIGREIWKRLKYIEGDYLGADHPDMAYRYDQLNVGCE